LTQVGCASVLFFPEHGLKQTPAALGLAYEEVGFSSLDGTPLHGWWLPAQGTALGTVLFYHGNAQNIASHIGNVRWLPAAGYNVFLFDYRGYGKSAGAPSLAGVHRDGRAALRFLSGRLGEEPFVVLGQSIGGAIATYSLAAEGTAQVRAVALESTFASYRDITREKLGQMVLTWPLQWPLSYLMPERYSAGRGVAHIAPVPLLVIHGSADRTVPIVHGERLFDLAGEPKTFLRVQGGRHISALTMRDDQYRQQLLNFFGKALGHRSSGEGP
jgi:fermentation-respiration switch protein FrsA (DUF1100 family)